MPTDPPCWLRKAYLGVSTVSAVARFLFLTSAPRYSFPNQQDCLWEQEVSPVSDITFGLSGYAEVVALPKSSLQQHLAFISCFTLEQMKNMVSAGACVFLHLLMAEVGPCSANAAIL